MKMHKYLFRAYTYIVEIILITKAIDYRFTLNLLHWIILLLSLKMGYFMYLAIKEGDI